MRFKAGITALVAALVCAAPAQAHHPRLEFRGQAIIPTGTTFEGTTVGGLSSWAYDAKRDVYYAVSDDQGQFQPARYYTISLRERDGRLSDGDVTFDAVTTLLAPDGNPYPNGSLDPEGFGLTKDRKLILTSEGFADKVPPIDPFVRRYRLDGTFLNSLPVPEAYLPNAAHTRGVRNNLGFESAGITPDGRHLFTASENALVQDGPIATVDHGSPARILRYDLRSGRPDRQWFYETDPVAEPPVPATQFSVNGIDDILPLSDRFLMVMERSFSVGAPGTGNTIKLYTVELGRKHAHKKLLLNLNTLGIPLDNVEGLTFGPRLRDGRQSLVLVSDNNFAASQFTQFLLFAVK
jgi:3-phytase